MTRVGSSNDGSSIKRRPQNVLFGRPKNVDIVRPTNVEVCPRSCNVQDVQHVQDVQELQVKDIHVNCKGNPIKRFRVF